MINPFKTSFITAVLALTLASGAMAEIRLLDRIVAVVNDGAIMASELDDRVAVVVNQFQQRGQPLPPPDVLRRQLVNRMITEKLQLQAANRMGIRVDDASLNQTLASIARQNGLSLDEFVDAVEADQYQWPQFREQIREEMIISRLQQRSVASRIRITEREVDRFLDSELGQSLFDAELQLSHILIRLPAEASPEQVREAEQKTQQLRQQLADGADFSALATAHSDAPEALDGGDLGWRSLAQWPSLFAEAARTMNVGDTSDALRSGAGFHLIKLTDRRSDAETVVTQHQARHILIRSDALTTASQAQQRAERLRQRVISGDISFADAARQFSDDPGSARDGGSLGWVTEGEMVPEFEQVMLALELEQLSPVFTTQFGAHFMVVDQRRDADMTQEFIRMQARQAIQRQRFEEELESWLQEQRADAYVDLRL